VRRSFGRRWSTAVRQMTGDDLKYPFDAEVGLMPLEDLELLGVLSIYRADNRWTIMIDQTIFIFKENGYRVL